MPLTPEEISELTQISWDIRKTIIETTFTCGGSHIGGSLSQTDVLVALYFKYLNIDPARPDWADRDRFILSKGHGGVGWASVLAGSPQEKATTSSGASMRTVAGGCTRLTSSVTPPSWCRTW